MKIRLPKEKNSQLLALLLVVASCAVAAELVNGGTPKPTAIGVRLDPESISVDGIHLGMTESEVISVKGAPSDRKTGEDGRTYWSYPDMTYSIRFETITEGRLAVDWVAGDIVGIGSKPLLRPGEGDSVALKTLASLGEPEYDEMERCGFSVSPISMITLGYFDELDGTLYYSNGLAINVMAEKYWGATLSRLRTDHF